MIRAIIKGYSVTMDPETCVWTGASDDILEELKLATFAAQNSGRGLPVFDVANTIAEEAVAMMGGHLTHREQIDPEAFKLIV